MRSEQVDRLSDLAVLSPECCSEPFKFAGETTERKQDSQEKACAQQKCQPILNEIDLHV
jgi:hypothetical protein